MTKGDDIDDFEPITVDSAPAHSEGTEKGKEAETTEQESKKVQGGAEAGDEERAEGDGVSLSADDLTELGRWINPEYLRPSVMSEINDTFCAQSSMQLQRFLRQDVAAAVGRHTRAADAADQLGAQRPPSGYSVGVSEVWKVVGPPHKRRHLLYSPPDPSTAAVAGGGKGGEGGEGAEEAGCALYSVMQELLRSPAWGRYLEAVTSLRVTAVRGAVRRFRPGLDYTVAHYGAMTKDPRLDATLCFVAGIEQGEHDGGGAKGEAKGEGEGKDRDQAVEMTAEEQPSKKVQKAATTKVDEPQDDESDDEEDDDEDDDEEGNLWASGDVGGYECYIEADESEGAEGGAAEVYRSGDGGGEEGEEGSLLSVSPGFNVLSLVMRDEKVMRFIKYVSANAPSSRWDVAVEYQFQASNDDQGDDDEDDDEDDAEGGDGSGDDDNES